MRKQWVRLFLICLAFLIPSSLFAGQSFYTCDGLPTTAGWNVYGTTSTENGNSITSAVTADGGSNTWRLQDSSTSYRCSERNDSLGNIDFNIGATVAARIRCSANSSGSSYNIGISNGNVGGAAIRIRSNAVGLLSLTGTLLGSASFTSDTVNYHTYYVSVQNGTPNQNGTAVWRVYRDGSEVITYTGIGAAEAYDGFYAGHYGTTGTGTWYFDWIACNNDGAYSPAQWDPTIPPAATVTAPANGSTVVIRTPTIQWTAAASDMFEVHINTTNNPVDADGWNSGQVTSGANSCVSGSLANGSYYIFVRLHSPSGWGPWSAANYSFTVNAPTAPPGAPTITAPIAGSTSVTHVVPVAWTGDTHDAYQVHINTTNNPSDANAWDSGAVTNGGNSCNSGSLGNGSYYVFVRLQNLVGWGAWSAGINFAVDIPPVLPDAPRVITPNEGANVPLQNPVIRWIGSGYDKYEVHINTTNNPADSDGWTSGQVASSNDWCNSGILPNGAYHVFVRLHNVDGWGPWSAGHSFDVSFTGADRKNGWIFLEDDQPYNLDLISHAREYHINHLQLSHDIMMYAYEPTYDSARRARINDMINAAHANDISEVVLWVHDVMTNYMPANFLVNGKINCDDPAFWTWLASQYQTLFTTVCPNVDGIVMTYSECSVDLDNRNLVQHTGKSPIDTFEKAIRTVWNVCQQYNKSMYVRTWGADRWIRDGLLRNDPQIWMMNKGTGPGDWNVIQEDYSIMGTATGHPELEELDYAGEYWGTTYTPWAGVDFIQHLWNEFALPKGVKGMAARLGRNAAGVFETPTRINMAAQDILCNYPDCPSDDIYQWWSSHWFGASGQKVASSMKRTFEITNACYNLPTVYPTSRTIAFEDLRAATYDIDCVKTVLQGNTTYQAGTNAYDLFHGRLMNAQTQLGAGAVPSTLFGDFNMSLQTNPTCSIMVVDAAYGLNPGSFSVEYSSDGGSTWTNHANFTVTAAGASTEPYTVTANSVPFGSLAAGKNKLRLYATNLASQQSSQIFTARALDTATVMLGSSILSDGLVHPQGGDGDTVSATAGGRSCRTAASSSDVYFYFQSDGGFAHDFVPKSVYLSVDYYGSSGSIRPYYDCYFRTDQPLNPVYLSGGTTWRTATWKLDSIAFQRRFNGNDFGLYVGASNGTVFISAVRLSYAPPSGTLSTPINVRAISPSPTNMTVAWQPVPGANRYQVCRGGAAVGWPTGTSFSDSGLSANTQYAYTVTAFDAANNTSPAAYNTYANTLAVAPSGSTLTCNQTAGGWQTSALTQFTAVGSFGAGKVAYYQYAWDQSPTHQWTGNEASWPAIGAPTGTGWNVWRATQTPINVGPWLMYEGDPTQRTNSVENVLEGGVPTWRYNDQGRVFGTKAKIGTWPNVSISRGTGFTVSGRVRCIDEPSGWFNTSTNFGINFLNSPDVGISLRPDSTQWIDGSWISTGDLYGYHTYTITVLNDTFTMYRDSVQIASSTQAASGATTTWSGPFFGHWRSDATGGWAWQWIAWNNMGAFAPANAAPVGALFPNTGTYYWHFRAFNSEGAPSGTTDFGPYNYWNGSTLLTPVVTDDGAFTTADTIHARWTAVGPSATYEYAIGTSVGGQEVVPFTGAAASLEVTRTGLTLSEGSTYYVTVRGTSGSNSVTASSDGIAVAPRCERIAEAKALADGSPTALYGKTVSAIFPDCVYIQSPNVAGIKVVTVKSLAIGDVIDLAGTVTGADTEKRIDAGAVFTRGAGSILPPAMGNSAIGGADYAYNSSTKTGQKGAVVYDADQLGPMSAANNAGMLVTTWGRVTWSGQDSFYITDGSPYSDFAAIGANTPAGVKVSIGAGIMPPNAGSYVGVTGVVSTYQLDGGLRRLILVSRQSDVRLMQ